jgi:glycosyltransferase involved in cell wall biosynthesis
MELTVFGLLSVRRIACLRLARSTGGKTKFRGISERGIDMAANFSSTLQGPAIPSPGSSVCASRSPGLSIVILTQQISHYHAARYRAVTRMFDRVTVIASMNDAEFRELICSDFSQINTVVLFTCKDEYFVALANGRLWSATHAALDCVRPNVVAVAGWSSPESLAAIDWAYRNDARVVMMSESQQQDGPRYRLREWVKSRLVRLCHAALVGGTRHRDYVVKLGMPRQRVFLGYDVVDNAHFTNGSDLARVDASNARSAHELPTRYILASARFMPKKNLERLVEAFARALSLTSAPHSLVVMGDGSGRAALENSVSAAGLRDRVRLPGFKSYDALPLFYGLAEAFVHVSITEQWGLVINEAAAAGLPLIVSHRCGAAPELVNHGANGYFVDPLDVEDIARRLASVMLASEGVLREMGTESRRIVAAWGLQRFAEGLHKACETAMSSESRIPTLWDKALIKTLSRRLISTVS